MPQFGRAGDTYMFISKTEATALLRIHDDVRGKSLEEYPGRTNIAGCAIC